MFNVLFCSPCPIPILPRKITAYDNYLLNKGNFQFPSNISFPSLIQKPKPAQSATIDLALWIHRTEDELKLHFDLAR